MNNARLINQTSGEVEYYTPPEILEAARRVMGGVIHTDPASCRVANERVLAATFFSKFDNGLEWPWYGNVWMNHPFHQGEEVCEPSMTGRACKRKTCVRRGYHCRERIPGNGEWVEKLLSEYREGNMVQACCITYACTSERWFRPLLKWPQCFLEGRTNYLRPDGTVFKGVTKGSVVTYVGCEVERFARAFEKLGVVKVPYGMWGGA
jgi:hypothetical protein